MKGIYRTELLAPAGSPEALLAGLKHGANAVYLGLQSFNARSNAVNFSLAELAYWVPIIHNQYQARVYVTLNTVVKVQEMEPILSILEDLVQCGVDGVIFQDMGLAKILRDYYPELRRHASTQLAVHSVEGVRFCVDLGIERVVLAREITLKELKIIRNEFPRGSIELEIFCHGAMCYTYSGMCLFSGAVGGRSGNRGACAYTCRKGYRILNETRFPEEAAKGSFQNYLFSMKDMNTLYILDRIVETGIDSLKIEGRRKGPDYVGSTVASYRAALTGQRDLQREHDSTLAFGRDYTAAFYEKGQYGDAPVDNHASGTRGLLIGTLLENNSFQLLSSGIQRRDGINIVQPDHTQVRMAFNGYRVGHGSSHEPEKGTWITLKEKMPAGSQVFWIKSQRLEQSYTSKVPVQKLVSKQGGRVNLSYSIHENMLQLTYTSPYASVTETMLIEESRSKKILPLKETLFRFGDTPFIEGIMENEEEVPGFIPRSKLKAARRDLLSQLEQSSVAGKQKKINSILQFYEMRSEPGESKKINYIIRTDQIEILEGLIEKTGVNHESLSFEFDFLARASQKRESWDRTLAILGQSKVPHRFSLPMVLREWDLKVMRRRIQQANGSEWSVSNAGQIPLFDKADVLLHADFPLYVLNPWALHAWQECGIKGRFTPSIEDDGENLDLLLRAVPPEKVEIIAYTDTPLFIAEGCSLAALYGTCPGAKACGRETLHIENEHGDQYSIFHDRCRSVVLGEQPFSWSGMLSRFVHRGVRHFRLDFCQKPYSVEEAWGIIKHVIKDEKIQNSHSENLFKVLV